jgi:hypothetical protein
MRAVKLFDRPRADDEEERIEERERRGAPEMEAQSRRQLIN